MLCEHFEFVLSSVWNSNKNMKLSCLSQDIVWQQQCVVNGWIKALSVDIFYGKQIKDYNYEKRNLNSLLLNSWIIILIRFSS